MKKRIIIFLCLLSLSSAAVAAEKQSHAEIQRVAMAFLQAQTQAMQGKVSLKVEDIDPRVAFPPCSQLEAFLPTGAQMRGKTSIGIRCNDKTSWSLFIPATITVTMNMLVSSRALQQGTVIGNGDFSIQAGELTQPGIITDAAQVTGQVLKFSIGAGQLFKQDMFRAPYAVTQGQTVQLFSEGGGITLRSEGKALNNAAAGQTTQVRVASGQVINGIARENGTVEVRP